MEQHHTRIPFEIDCLDDEAQCRTDSTDILVHDSFDNGCFACIVETT